MVMEETFDTLSKIVFNNPCFEKEQGLKFLEKVESCKYVYNLEIFELDAKKKLVMHIVLEYIRLLADTDVRIDSDVLNLIFNMLCNLV
jgi:hypothetical protein